MEKGQVKQKPESKNKVAMLSDLRGVEAMISFLKRKLKYKSTTYREYCLGDNCVTRRLK